MNEPVLFVSSISTDISSTSSTICTSSFLIFYIPSYLLGSVNYENLYRLDDLGYSLPLLREAFPPESAPSGSAPVGVSPLRCSTDSDSSLKKWSEKYSKSEFTAFLILLLHIFIQILIKPHLSTENTLAILPIALILFRMTSFRSFAWPVRYQY